MLMSSNEAMTKYAIARKGSPYVMIIVDSYEEALTYIKGKENVLEIRHYKEE